MGRRCLLLGASVLLVIGTARATEQNAALSAVRLSHQRGSPFQPTPPRVDDDHDIVPSGSRRHDTAAPALIPLPVSSAATQLLVGVKSAALSGVESRKTIRQTWAHSAHRPRDVAVVFLACEPDWAALNGSRARPQQALEQEKATHADLLTSELACVDSYWTLVDKVQGFFQWVASSPTAALAYVVLVDDDVYVDLPQLRAMLLSDAVPRARFYAGQVIETQFGIVMRPLRDPTEKNYVPRDVYPLNQKPPIATGAIYMLSVDLVHFLARNSDQLRGVGTLEDVSVAFWLLALRGVRPVHVPQVDNVRFTLCHNALVAYADVSPLAMRRIHDNLSQNRSFCDGFELRAWDKRSADRPPQLPRSQRQGGRRVARSVRHHWDLRFNESSRVLHIVATISVDANESAVAVFTPAQDSFDAFCRVLLRTAETSMPTTALPPTFCLDQRGYLEMFLTSAATAAPAVSAMYALGRTNVRADSNSLAVFVQLPSLGAATPADHAARFPSVRVDLVVATSAADAAAAAASNDAMGVPPRVMAFRDVASNADATSWSCEDETSSITTIEIVSFLPESSCARRHRLYLPVASQSFAWRRSHSPVALLHAAVATNTRSNDNVDVVLLSCHQRYAVAAAAADVLVSALESEHLTVTTCDDDSDNRNHDDRVSSLDDDVVRFADFRFVVVVEDRVHVPGHVSHQLVSAFLAGAVPVYVGHSATVTKLFNPRALIDCGSFVSLRACARHVRDVAASPTRYAAMTRQEPPVVNTTAFVELFSWHPHVIEMAHQALKPLLVGEHLRALINNA